MVPKGQSEGTKGIIRKHQRGNQKVSMGKPEGTNSYPEGNKGATIMYQGGK